MNPPSERRFHRLPLAKADAGASLSACDDAQAGPGVRFLRAKGPAPYQPRATPWVTRRKNHLCPEGAAQAPRPQMSRPFRA